MIFSRADQSVRPQAADLFLVSRIDSIYINSELLTISVDHLRFQNRQTSIWHRVFSPCLSKLQRSVAGQLGSDIAVQVLQFSRYFLIFIYFLCRFKDQEPFRDKALGECTCHKITRFLTLEYWNRYY